MKTARVLILEDDLEALSVLLKHLAGLEEELIQEKEAVDLAVTVYSSYKDVEELVNNNRQSEFDVILLDRDCKLSGSFHVLDIERFGPERIVSISSVPDWNEDAKKRGINRIVLKDFFTLDEFASETLKHVTSILEKQM